MTLLTYNDKRVVQSTTRVQTTGTTLVDDTPAVATFTLTASKTVLITYQSNNSYGEMANPIEVAIKIDSNSAVAKSWDGQHAYGGYKILRNTTFWIGTLGVGSHTIKGQFASRYAGQTATINNRILIVMIFNGDEYQYIDSTTQTYADSPTLQNDSQASITFTPSANCVALYLYNATNYNAESIYGKKIAINVNGYDYNLAGRGHCGTGGQVDSCFTFYAERITNPVQKTVKGRFANNYCYNRVYIDRRQFGILLFDSKTLFDLKSSTTQICHSLTTEKDDNDIIIDRDQTYDQLLMFLRVHRHHGTSSAGEHYGIWIDNVLKHFLRCSTYYQSYSSSMVIIWAQTIATGYHNIKCRISSHLSGYIARADERTVLAIWFYSPPEQEPGEYYYIFYQNLDVVTESTMGISKKMSKTIGFAENSIITMNRIKSFYRTISATSSCVVSMTKKMFKEIANVLGSLININRTKITDPKNRRNYLINNTVTETHLAFDSIDDIFDIKNTFVDDTMIVLNEII